jgi:hypothetical protein
MRPGHTVLRRFAYCAALLLTGVALGVFARSFSPSWARPIFTPLLLNTPAAVAAIFGAAAVSVLVHELGHLLAAVQLNFEVLSTSLGPLRLQWLHGKYAFRFSGKRLWLGSVGVVPKEMENWRRRAMWIAASGPLATLLTALAAGGVVVSSTLSGAPLTFWCALAQLNLLIFVLGIFPNNKHASSRNDAALFWLLFHNGPEAREMELVYLVGQLKLHAVRPADYPEPLMDRLVIHRATRPDTRVLAARTMSDWALDCGDVGMADRWDREAITHTQDCHPRLRNSVWAASACFDVLFRGDAASARAKLAEVDLDALFPPCFAHRVRAARLLAIGLPDKAPAEIIRAQYALPTGLAYYDFERMLLEKMHLQALAGNCKNV